MEIHKVGKKCVIRTWFLSVMLAGLILINTVYYASAQPVDRVGHVTLVRAYDLPNTKGCHAIVQVPSSTQPVAAYSTSDNICNLLTTGLETGYKISFRGEKMPQQPVLIPGGAPTPYEFYSLVSVILYNTY